jgi:ElaB/YqjD/DUF883 family membrane-anchored ribosome-binding protein
MGKSSDQLREEIDAQRNETGQKIDNLQHQIQDQVEGTRQQVTDTASQVADTVTHVREEAQAMVSDTVDSVKQSVESSMQNFDLEKMVQERPLVAAGAAMLAGFLLGGMLGGDNNSSNRYSGSHPSGAETTGSGSSAMGIGHSMREAAKKSGLEDTISNAGAALMGTMTDQLKQMVDRNFPGFSDKLDTAVNQDGSFKEKVSATQQ